MQLRTGLALLVGTATTLVGFLALRHNYFEPNLCSMSYSRPIYYPLEVPSPHSKVKSKYGLYLYREGGQSPIFESLDDVNNLGGTPVLFIPGNAGSYNQGRSLASLASENTRFDWFLVHFDEDLSALHGKTLLDEARYVNDVIAFILNLYKRRSDKASAPSSVIIIGHSMGGIAARTLVTLDNYVENSVNTIMTLSTPHAYPPITFDRDVTQLYDLVGRWWRYKSDDVKIALVSIAGGHKDLLVLPDMTVIDSLGGISAYSYEIPDVGMGIDHLAIVWCAELRSAIIDALNDIVDPKVPGRTLPYKQRMSALAKILKHADDTETVEKVIAPRSLLFGMPFVKTVNKKTEFQLPARSSLVSYVVECNAPAEISHRTEKEFRSYGKKKLTMLMWYSNGPYVPFSNHTEPLSLIVDPSIDSDSKSVLVAVRIDWSVTLANSLIHYRTLAACWPYATVMLTLALVVKGQTDFGSALFGSVIGAWLNKLAALLCLVHFILIFPKVRSFIRAFQFPSEAKNAASLAHRGFDSHDLLLGVTDWELFWIAPLLLSIAVTAVTVVYCLSSFIVVSNTYIQRKLQIISTADDAPAISHRQLTRKLPILVGLTLILYLVPYQVSTVILTGIQLLQIQDRKSVKFAVNQLLLWTSVVDAPIIAVWVRNLTLEWIWAFASFRNVWSSMPIAIYVFYFNPSSGGTAMKKPFTYPITLCAMIYIVAYALIYGGLHAFMLHHLTNHLIAWLILVYSGRLF